MLIQLKDPERYGVVEFDENFRAISIEEKPSRARSSFAVPGIYFYDNQVSSLAANLLPSHRNEIEITDLNKTYMSLNQLKVEVLGRGIAWLDAGTHESLLQAATFVQTVQERQGLMISCPEEIAYRRGWITIEDLKALAEKMGKNQYADYLSQLTVQQAAF